MIISNRYKLIKQLGEGGFGEVWLAEDQTPGRQVALKLYKINGRGHDELVREFNQVFDLDSVNLVKAKHVDRDESQGISYLVMDYCRYGSLTQMVGRINEQEMWRCIRDIASGLMSLAEHTVYNEKQQREIAAPVVHQDLKPANILIRKHDMDGHNVYAIADFGISKTTVSQKSGSSVFVSAGTLAYMGPERFFPSYRPRVESDIWSLGAMLYEMVEGRLPFPSMEGLSGGNWLNQKDVELPKIENRAISSNLCDLIYSCMAKEPEKRPTAKQLYDYSDKILRHEKCGDWKDAFNAKKTRRHEDGQSKYENEDKKNRVTQTRNHINEKYKNHKGITQKEKAVSRNVELLINSVLKGALTKEEVLNHPYYIDATDEEKKYIQKQIRHKLSKYLKWSVGSIVLVLIVIGIIFIARPNSKSDYPTQTKNVVTDIDPSDWIPFEQNGKWGFKDTDGNVTITAQFDDAWSFSDGRAPIEKNGKCGFIDKTGSIVIPTKYEDVISFKDGMARVKINNKYGYIDTSGKFVIEANYSSLGRFWDDFGLADVWKNDNVGFIDRSGKIVVEPIYESWYGAKGGVLCRDLSLTYLIDKNGNILASYPFIWNFSDGMAAVTVKNRDEYKVGFIDATGKLVIPTRFDVKNQSAEFSNGLAAVEVDGKCGYINKTGSFVIQPQYSYAGKFSEGLAPVIVNNEWHYINSSGNIVFSCGVFTNWNDLSYFEFHDGLACFITNHKYGFIDKTGRVVIEPRDAYLVSRFSEGFAVVKKDDDGGGYYIDKTGKKVFGLEFDDAWAFSNEIDGLAHVRINNKDAYINTDGKIVKYIK